MHHTRVATGLIYYTFLAELESRGPQSYCPTHIINVEVQDNQDEATLGAFLIYELCERVGRRCIRINDFTSDNNKQFNQNKNYRQLLISIDSVFSDSVN